MKIKNINKLAVATLALLFAFGLSLPSTLFAASPMAVNLSSAGSFTILSKTGVSTTGSTSIVGDMGVSPAPASYITGFALTLPAASSFATSTLVAGKIYAPDYASPASASLTSAILDMQNAYTDAMGRAPNVTELGAGNIGGLTLAPGVYKWGTGVTIPSNVTLSGGANDVWIFQIAQNLTVSGAAHIILSGGAQAGNIFWVVAGQTTLGSTAAFNGNILDQTAIVLNTGATLTGRALAQTAITLDSNSVIGASSSTSGASSSNAAEGQGLNTSSSTSSSTQTGTGISNSSVSSNTNTSATTYTYNDGCDSTTSFSRTTGQPCSNIALTITTPVAYNFGALSLKSGSQGQAVIELQRFLNLKLNLSLVVDGKLGPKTLAAITKWQSENNLVADGVVGIRTKAAMQASVQ
jgi:hypothetical protein